MKPMLAAVVTIAALALAGCASSPVFNFKQADGSGVGAGPVAMALVGGRSTREAASPLDLDLTALLGESGDLNTVAARDCGVKKATQTPQALLDALEEHAKGMHPLVAGALVPVIASVGSLMVTQFVDALAQKAAKLEAAANPEPGVARIIVMGEQFNAAKCVMFVRFAAPRDPAKPEDPSAGGARLVVLLELVPVPEKTPAPDAFMLRPVYVRALDSVAITTDKRDDGRAPRIDIASALAIKEVARSTNPESVAGVFPGSQAGVQVAAVPLGKDDKGSKIRCNEPTKPVAQRTKDDPPPCADSDVLARPYPHRVISVSMSVAEVGNVGFDVKLAQAELKAIAQAMGPAVGAAIGKRLDP